MLLSILFLTLLAALFSTYVTTKIALVYANKTGLIDHPGERSSHKISTPRGGGISIIIIFLVLLLVLSITENINLSVNLIMGLVISCGIIAVIGFWDDHRDISAKLRFSIHCITSIIALSLLDNLPYIPFFSINIELLYFSYPFYALTLVWLLNLYNFMDGIDGIASIEAITVAVNAGFILLLGGENDISILLFLLAACVAGFLIWNWPPAKIFMGDACSGFLGFILGFMAIITSISGTINVWSWLILLAVFVVDATYTLIRRMIRGDKWYHAHRSHAYQILARKYQSHKIVTIGVLVINVFWLFPLAYLASIYEYWAALISLVAILPLILVAYKVNAGLKND